MIRAEAGRLGIAQRPVEDATIVDRLLFALVNEGYRVLEEGIAQRASDIDLIYVNGYGFPAVRGGPMFHAQTVGLSRVLARIREFAAAEPAYWEPAPLLLREAEAAQG